MRRSEHEDSLRRVAAELSFETTDEMVEACLDNALALEEDTDVLYDDPDPVKEAGHASSDEYNALLAVYDEPRRRSDDGSLDDLSLAVKDSITVEGLRMTAGSKDFSLVPANDAIVVERLLDAGAAIVGKANLEAFAFGITGENSDFGMVSNPVAEDTVPGGSSSGSAVAVAGGLVDAAIGTDAGGSVRIPAACCGLVGAKTTHRLVPRHGLVDFAPSMDTIGPIGHDVETVARVLDVIAGHDLRDPSSSRVEVGSFVKALDDTDDLSVGVPESLLDPATDGVTDTVLDLAERLDERPSVTVSDVDLELGSITTAYLIISAAEFAWVLRQTDAIRGPSAAPSEELRAAVARAKADGVSSPHLAWRVLAGAYLDVLTDGKAYTAAREEVIALQERLDALFDDVDVLLAPTLRRLPPGFGEIETLEDTIDMLGNPSVFNLTGNPAVAVPAGEVDELPVSAMFVAPHFEDGRALAAARLAERVTEGN